MFIMAPSGTFHAVHAVFSGTNCLTQREIFVSRLSLLDLCTQQRLQGGAADGWLIDTCGFSYILMRLSWSKSNANEY